MSVLCCNMPKIIELTVEIDIDKVSCPGVWLCQDGKVSLTIFALGTSYQTCLLPPVFPLMFKDIFYFRKRFQETCALNNICCLLKDETIYCELVQWCEDCVSSECVMLAQYLGALNDVLFPPNMCSNDGIDLLMRRSKEFPGILSPKIEIATKVRIDEVWNQPCSTSPMKMSSCKCYPNIRDGPKQKPVCHSARYHRNRCTSSHTKCSRSRSKSRSDDSRSCCSLLPQESPACSCQNPVPAVRTRVRRCAPSAPRPCPQYSVYNVTTQPNPTSKGKPSPHYPDVSDLDDDGAISNNEPNKSLNEMIEDKLQKITVESRFIDQDKDETNVKGRHKKTAKIKLSPCVCEICTKYYELFHNNKINY